MPIRKWDGDAVRLSQEEFAVLLDGGTIARAEIGFVRLEQNRHGTFVRQYGRKGKKMRMFACRPGRMVVRVRAA